ncbi:FUZ isoform 19 [Pan troglodytes]|uniref:Fuzzy planar cell polarity protein n=2 Tax=Homininae TaxID=207598 RepID=M0QYX9_HUMAN|nr:fuzzy planar cell polarity protein [Homo sapiens]KAI4044045.1 fuzzy planar cell polarity protein [Homo sapiens]PNI16399.1 FUZ isoform 19 [Pan troglodytes]
MGEEGTGGTVHLLCLAASSGVPLFCRSSRGGAPARQQNLEVQLSSARTENTTVVWKSFHDRSPGGNVGQGQGLGDSPC